MFQRLKIAFHDHPCGSGLKTRRVWCRFVCRQNASWDKKDTYMLVVGWLMSFIS